MISIGEDLTGPELKPAVSTPDLVIGRYQLIFRAECGSANGRYLGSAWRGILGQALKRLVCVTREPDCSSCLLYRSCVYPYIFETPPPDDSQKLRLYPAAPHPYVLEPDRNARSDGRYTLTLALVGRANQYALYLFEALRRAGARGLNGIPGALALESILQESSAGSDEWVEICSDGGTVRPRPAALARIPVYAGAGRLRIELQTPLRLRIQEQYVRASQISFRDLLANLLRRISLLIYFHSGNELKLDFREMLARSEAIRIEHANLRWHDWTRYSSRQKARMQMGGVMGNLEIAGPGLESFWPYLWIGQFLHAGKAATMGLGQYRIEVPAQSSTSL